MVRRAKEDVLPKQKLKVTARVTDQFFRPPINRGNSQELKNLANAMSGIVPSLSRNEMANFEAEKEKQTVAGYEKQKQLKKSFKQAVADGDIPEGANPYFVLAYNSLEVEDLGRKWSSQFKDVYAQQQGALLDNDDPTALNQLIDDNLAEFWESNGLSGYDSQTVLESFEPKVNATRNELNSMFSNQRIAYIEDKAYTSVSENFLDVLESAPNIITVDDGVTDNVLNISQIVGSKLNQIINKNKDSMNVDKLNTTAIDTLITYAENELDPDLLDIASHIETVNGKSLADIPKYKEILENAEDKIFLEIDQLETRKERKEERVRKAESRKAVSTFYDAYYDQTEDQDLFPTSTSVRIWARANLPDYTHDAVLKLYKAFANEEVETNTKVVDAIYELASFGDYDAVFDSIDEELKERNISGATAYQLRKEFETISQGANSSLVKNSNLDMYTQNGVSLISKANSTEQYNDNALRFANMSAVKFRSTFDFRAKAYASLLLNDDKLNERERLEKFNSYLEKEYMRQVNIFDTLDIKDSDFGTFTGNLKNATAQSKFPVKFRNEQENQDEYNTKFEEDKFNKITEIDNQIIEIKNLKAGTFEENVARDKQIQELLKQQEEIMNSTPSPVASNILQSETPTALIPTFEGNNN